LFLTEVFPGLDNICLELSLSWIAVLKLSDVFWLDFVLVCYLAMIMVCPCPFMAALDSGVASAKPPKSRKSFKIAKFVNRMWGNPELSFLSSPTDYQLTQLPPKFVMGKSVRV
jgi:hypothetical protein